MRFIPKIKPSKDDLRNLLLAQLKQLKIIDQCSDLLDNLMPLLDNANTIVVYHAHGHEISLNKVVEYTSITKKTLLQPVAYRNTKIMELDLYDESHCAIFSVNPDPNQVNHNRNQSKNNHHQAKTWSWGEVDLILLPLIGVDTKGNRLGRGGGYYDATLANVINQPKRPILCGVGFALQLLDSTYTIAHNEWDIQLDYFANNAGLIQFTDTQSIGAKTKSI
jgi:5-formyltetrahydrofolate cyclo-ligase